MRPIRLEFSGLHSYREQQSVDFTQLLSGGLFGVFGPTGSGKSTVLDAITLALYGKVERAPRGTWGILNQAEQQASVKFTFDLGEAEQVRRYRVERSYRRTDDVTVRPTHVRLVEITDAGEQVLADRGGDVNERVQEIIGLPMDDFTRAVVLLQGKFAEFLQLDGSERRRMLERIFALSDYGERLNQRLKSRSEGIENQINMVTAEQQGLGNASADALAEAARQVESAEVTEREATEHLQELATEHKEWQEVWEGQQKAEEVERALTEWQSHSAEAGVWREELVLAGRAETLRLPILALQSADQRLAATERAEMDAARELDGARQVEAQTTTQAEQLQNRQRTEGRGLIERRLALEQAVQLEGSAKTLAGEVATLAAELGAIRQLADENQKEVNRLTGQAASLQAEQLTTLSLLSQAEVSPEWRQKVQEALTTQKVYQEIAEQLRSAQARHSAQERGLSQAAEAEKGKAGLANDAAARLATAETELRDVEGKPPERADDLDANERWLARVEIHVGAVVQRNRDLVEANKALVKVSLDWDQAAAQQGVAQGAKRAAEDDLAQAKAAREAAQADLHAVERQYQAVALAEGLVAGEPCPVCGSTHHPVPASAEGQDSQKEAEIRLQVATQAVQAAEERVRVAGELSQKAEATAEGVRTRLVLAQEARDKAVSVLGEDRGSLPASWREQPAESLPGLLQSEVDNSVTRKLRFQEWQSQVEKIRRDIEMLRTEASEAIRQLAVARAGVQSYQQAAAEALANVEEATRLLQQRQAEVDRQKGDLGIADLAEESERIQTADKKVRHLRETLQSLASAHKQTSSELEASQQSEDSYSRQVTDLEVKLSAAQQQLASNESRLQQLAGVEPVKPQLATVEAMIRELDQSVNAAVEAARTAVQRLRECEVAAGAATREREVAAKDGEAASGTLRKSLDAAGFQDGETASAGLRTEKRRADLEAWVTAHDRNGERLTAKRQELLAALGGRKLDAEEWRVRQEVLADTQRAWQELHDSSTRARQTHGDLAAKHARWRELEEQRGALDGRQRLIQDLQRVLHGNAFVDFLAEGQLRGVAEAASARLSQLSRYRYALEIDSGAGFVIRDDANGGLRRPVSTLSGGETFLASLALALALSAQIQLRGRYPLEFFFLDEGFGSLDPELLNVVIDTLERLQLERLHVGLISHVPELRNRLQRRLIVEPAVPGGAGSRLRLELA